MFVLAGCFFSSYRADGMSNDSSANVLVSSIHNSMYYLGYVQFFYWLFLSFVSIAKATTIWRRADAIMGYKCFSIPSFQVNDWACSGWSIIWPLWIWVVHVLGMSVFIAPGVEGLISAGITWFSMKGKQIGDQSLPKDDKRGTLKN